MRRRPQILQNCDTAPEKARRRALQRKPGAIRQRSNEYAAAREIDCRSSQHHDRGIDAYRILPRNKESLKDLEKPRETIDLKEVLPLWRCGNGRMFKNPCVFMEKKDSMQASC